MILLIDNYDSFVHNLARYTGLAGRERVVVRNDAITIEEIAVMAPEAIILSPGPCTPADAGICLKLIEKFYYIIPILGICLGHQCIGEVFGGHTVRADVPMKNSTSCPSTSRKYSAQVRPVRPTRARAPGGSFIWP